MVIQSNLMDLKTKLKNLHRFTQNFVCMRDYCNKIFIFFLYFKFHIFFISNRTCFFRVKF